MNLSIYLLMKVTYLHDDMKEKKMKCELNQKVMIKNVFGQT